MPCLPSRPSHQPRCPFSFSALNSCGGSGRYWYFEIEAGWLLALVLLFCLWRSKRSSPTQSLHLLLRRTAIAAHFVRWQRNAHVLGGFPPSGQLPA